MRRSIIVAAAANDVIGRGNDLPWRLSADLRRFKRLTMGHHLIIGRKTWESIGRQLPGRTMLVVSRSNPPLPDSIRAVSSLERALEIAREAGDDEAFIAGGGMIYAAALPLADRLYLTRVHAEVDGDVFFPAFSESDFQLVESREGIVDEATSLPHSFLIYDRIPAS